MKQFIVKLHHYLDGYGEFVIWADDLETATNNAKERRPKGFAFIDIWEVK